MLGVKFKSPGNFSGLTLNSIRIIMNILNKISNAFVGHHTAASHAAAGPVKPSNQNLENAAHKLNELMSSVLYKAAKSKVG